MAKNNINVSLGVDINNLKKGLDEAVKAMQGGGKDMAANAKFMAAQVNDQINKIAAQGTMRGQLRQLENLAGKYTMMGQSGTKAFKDVIAETGKLKDEQEDLRALIQVAKPAGPFIAMGNAMKVAVGGANVLQGAMAMFGNESENVQKTMMKLQAGLAFANGLKELEGLKDSFTQLNFVMKANPAIMVAGAIAAIGAAIYGLNGFLNHTVNQFEALSKVQDKAFDSTVKERVELENYRDRLNDANLSQEDRKKLLIEISKKYPDYLGKLSQEGKTQKEINGSIDSYISLLDAKAQAQAAQDMYVESLKEEHKLSRDILEAKKNEINSIAVGNSTAAGLFKIQFEYKKQQLKNMQQDSAYYKNLYSDLSKVSDKAVQVQKDLAGTPTNTGTKTVVEKKKIEFENTVKGQGLPQTAKPNVGGLFAGGPVMETQPRVLDKNSQAYIELAKSMKQVEINGKEMDAMIKGSLTETIIGMSEALGNGDNIGAAFLGGLAGFLKQFGKMLIAAAIAKLSFEKLITSIGGAPVAIAAGVAMVAAASAVQKHLQAGAQKFATGGIVGGSSFSGDKVPALVNSGEMILNKAQQANLFSMINGGAGGYHVQLIPIIDNRGLAMQVEIGNKQRNRG